MKSILQVYDSLWSDGGVIDIKVKLEMVTNPSDTLIKIKLIP